MPPKPKFKEGTCCFSDYNKLRKAVVLAIADRGCGLYEYYVEEYPYGYTTIFTHYWQDILPFESEWREVTDIERVILFEERHAFFMERLKDGP